MTEFTDTEQTTATNGTNAPQKRRGPKPGAKKAAKPAVQEIPAPLPAEEIADAVNTMMSWPAAIRKCAMTIVAAMPERAD